MGGGDVGLDLWWGEGRAVVGGGCEWGGELVGGWVEFQLLRGDCWFGVGVRFWKGGAKSGVGLLEALEGCCCGGGEPGWGFDVFAARFGGGVLRRDGAGALSSWGDGWKWSVNWWERVHRLEGDFGNAGDALGDAVQSGNPSWYFGEGFELDIGEVLIGSVNGDFL